MLELTISGNSGFGFTALAMNGMECQCFTGMLQLREETTSAAGKKAPSDGRPLKLGRTVGGSSVFFSFLSFGNLVCHSHPTNPNPNIHRVRISIQVVIACVVLIGSLEAVFMYWFQLL